MQNLTSSKKHNKATQNTRHIVSRNIRQHLTDKYKNMTELHNQYLSIKKKPYAVSPSGFQTGSMEYKHYTMWGDRRLDDSHGCHRYRM